MKPPISCVVSTYNEESRIAQVLQHAVQWADEVLVIDKTSTDRTVAICQAFGPAVRVVAVPFTEQGDDRVRANLEHAQHDWVFVTTCSEVPTRPLIKAVEDLLANRGDEIDLIQVPRRMYSFGVHHPASPWSVCHYPFVLHRRRAIISDKIHANFSVADPARMAWIEYAEDVCVHHFTHATAEGFIRTHANYVVIEMKQLRDDEVEDMILCSLRRLRAAIRGTSFRNPEWFAVLVAWSIYHLELILLGVDRLRGVDIAARYQAARAAELARHWGQPLEQAPARYQTVRSPAAELLRVPLFGLVILGYAWVYCRHPRLAMQAMRSLPGKAWRFLRRGMRL